MIPEMSFLTIAIIVVLLVVILANVELYYNKSHCKYKVEMPKVSLVIMPQMSGLKHPLYIYDKSKIKKRDIDYQLGYNSNEYVKKRIPEHVASKIASPIMEITSNIKSIPNSKMPINTLYSSLGMSDTVIGNVNPLTYTDTSNYRMLIHNEDLRTEAFVAGRNLYII